MFCDWPSLGQDRMYEISYSNSHSQPQRQIKPVDLVQQSATETE